MQSLSLSGNSLSGEIPRSLAKLTQLKYFYVNNNAFDTNSNAPHQRLDKHSATQNYLGSLCPTRYMGIGIPLTPNTTLLEDRRSVLACWQVRYSEVANATS